MFARRSGIVEHHVHSTKSGLRLREKEQHVILIRDITANTKSVRIELVRESFRSSNRISFHYIGHNNTRTILDKRTAVTGAKYASTPGQYDNFVAEVKQGTNSE